MTFVVTESCIKCRYTECVDPCPVRCFHEGPNFLVIDPKVCIDCNLCIETCPVDAIYPDTEVPEDQLRFIQINADMAKEWPSIKQKKRPRPDADDWVDIAHKLKHLTTWK